MTDRLKLFFIFILVFIFAVGTASALTFDNVKSYDHSKKEYSLTNAFGLGGNIATINLNTPQTFLVARGYNKVAEFTITNGEWDYQNILKGMELYNIKDGMKSVVRNVDYKYKVVTKVPTYKSECGLKQLGNGTFVEGNCVQKQIGMKDKVEWVDFTANSLGKRQKITIGLFTDVKKDDHIEWIATVYDNERLTEWSEWTENLNTGLTDYWTMDILNGTNNGTFNNITKTFDRKIYGSPVLVSGLIENALNFTDIEGFTVSNRTFDYNTSFTQNFWINGVYAQTESIMFQTHTTETATSTTFPYFDILNNGTFSFLCDSGCDGITGNGNITLSNSTNHMITIQATSGLQTWRVYIDSALAFQKTRTATVRDWTVLYDRIKRPTNSSVPSYFWVDEIGRWNRTLNSTEISDLWNNSNGIRFKTISPTVTLNSPVDAFNTTNSTITFNGSSVFDEGVVNVSLYIDEILNETNSSGINNTNYIFTKTISDGSHNWTLGSCSSTGCSNATLRTFTIDSTIPAVAVSSPNETFVFHEVNTNLSVNWTVSDNALDTCTLEYDGVNTSVTCLDNSTFINITSFVNKTLTLYVNDTSGNSNASSVTWNYRLFLNNESFTSSVSEGTSSTFTINVTTNGTDITIGNLSHNNTENIGSISQTGNHFVINKSIIAPTVSADINASFFWNITQSDGIYHALTSQNQTVLNLNIDNCSVNTNVLYNFTIVDEESQSILLNNATQNTTAEIDLTILDIQRANTIANFSTTFSATNPFAVCFNSTMSSGETYVADAQIKYQNDLHEQEFYHIQNSTITTDDFPTNITLYDLQNASSQTFVITFKDSNFLPVQDALIQIQRKYISEGVFKVVEIPKTDSKGEAQSHLVLEDIVYTFIVVKNGETLGTFNEQTVNCQNPTLETCLISLNAVTSTIQPEDFTQLDDFTFTLDYNRTSRVVSSIFTIPSSTVSTVILNVTKSDTLGNTTVCQDPQTSAGGTLSCTVPLSFGNSSIYVKLTKDGVLQSSGIINLAQSSADTFGSNLVITSVIFYGTLIGVAISSNPMVTAFFLIIGAILGVALNFVNSFGFVGAGATILWLIIAIIIMLIKGGRRA